MRVAGKVAIVTSGTRGIGRACAERLAEDGAAVMVGDNLEPVAPFAGPDITFHRLDVTDEASWACIVADTIDRHGRLDILVNNATECRDATLDACSLEDWNTYISMNETGVFLGMRSVIPEMRKVGGGAIVNVSSMLGSVAVASAVALQATKGAVTLLTRSAAVSLIADNIRVNSVHPGYVEASLRWRQRSADGSGGPHKVGRAGQPRDIANGVLFLVSDEASYITGTGLFIDGGISALQLSAQLVSKGTRGPTCGHPVVRSDIEEERSSEGSTGFTSPAHVTRCDVGARGQQPGRGRRGGCRAIPRRWTTTTPSTERERSRTWSTSRRSAAPSPSRSA